MTMTTAPVFDHTSDLIDLHFDGRFVDMADLTNKGVKNTIWQTRLDTSNPDFTVQQNFVSQYTANQLVSRFYEN